MAGLPRLTAFTPLPPERNGIADYAWHLLARLARHYDCTAACEDWLAEAPDGVAVTDAALAHRGLAPGDRVLHQLGNNAGHGFVLRALRRLPGIVTLHDPGLMHLHEVTGEGTAAILAGMAAGGWPGLAARFGRQLRDHGLATRANHLLFDLAGEVLAASRAVIVHSRFAREKLRLLHGEAATAHVAVVPHLLPPIAMPARAAARARLRLAPEEVLVLTAGFATAPKRFDWLIAALDHALARGAALRWIHAGAERPAEYALSRHLAAVPAVAAIARTTGYLPEAALNDHIAAADVLVNLRFPSHGESSGSIARALAAGTCCIVSDTGAYAELPREAVLHIPLADAVPRLAEALIAIAAAPEKAWAIGAAGRRHAEAELDLPGIARAYAAVIEASRDRPVAPPSPPPAEPPLVILPAWPAPPRQEVEAALRQQPGPCRLLLEVPGLEALAELTLDLPGLVSGLLPPEARLRALRVQEGTRPGLLLELG
ncbi:glycosyltransferase family 4 protein [Siccirubricoccus sp. KC 17139]|uniref:Glycosyltransferase family 4 protein n=1 Tax=Siccirubricoccus soli TaxID=2899147 RepID=A0ABT1D7D1_9PROT|nr:glycosyltransferase family 4 protein [Siccirubricoccus soli]MCO6417836.1 glycosyltransferase family 4 protein [Siccirubricoccus soli]MCP2683971.1 glycosyltransferase family 4 protein [Siccirubricoccus soli]